MMKRSVFIGFFVMLWSVCLAQLGLPLTQFSSNPMAFNPACSGLDDAFSLNFSFRKHWAGMPNSPTLVNFGGHAPFENHKHSWGALLQHESWGPLSGNFVYGNYSYKLFFANSSLSFGLQAGAFHSVLNWDKVTHVPEEGDPNFGAGREQKIDFDANFGVYYYTKFFYVGLSAKHLIPPKWRFDKGIPESETWHPQMGTQFFLMSGAAVILDEDWSVRPEVFFRYVNATPLSVNAGVHGSYRHQYFFGINYESGQKALSFSLKAQVTNELRIGYSYDVYLGVIRSVQGGSHEISMNYLLKELWKKRKKAAEIYNPYKPSRKKRR